MRSDSSGLKYVSELRGSTTPGQRWVSRDQKAGDLLIVDRYDTVSAPEMAVIDFVLVAGRAFDLYSGSGLGSGSGSCVGAGPATRTHVYCYCRRAGTPSIASRLVVYRGSGPVRSGRVCVVLVAGRAC